jgi:transcriptional regulator PpsR
LDADAAATLISAASDVALVVDGEGVIRDVAVGSSELSLEGYSHWVGQPWTATVTVESRPKVEALLRDAQSPAPRRWRHVNHPSAGGPDIPILYSAVQVGEGGQVVAFGRDLRSVSALQQRLMDAQQAMERDYWRLRHVETRYRMLFQMASEAIVIVDSATNKVMEVNPAAGLLFGETHKRLTGRIFPEGFDAPSTKALEEMLARARAVGRAEEITVRLAKDPRAFVASASMVNQDNAALILVRIATLQPDADLPRSKSMLLRAVESAPDGFVVTDFDGRVLTANQAFVQLVQLTTEDQAQGESLERWLGRPGVDLNVLLSNLRQHGVVRLFATTLRGEYGSSAEVEISAVAVPHGEQRCMGFTIRHVGQRLLAEPRAARNLPRSVEQLTELVGRVSLKELVRESTDLIERLCIEAALELTRDNRASAADMLGLSRQSLYVKLRRYGLGDLSSESE